METIVKVADNSGAKIAKCIKVLGGFKKKQAYVGDIIIVSVQKLRNRFKETSKVKKKEIYKGLVIRTKKSFFVKNGENIKFNDNAIILINKQNTTIGTRIFGPVPKILNKKRFQKLISISSKLV